MAWEIDEAAPVIGIACGPFCLVGLGKVLRALDEAEDRLPIELLRAFQLFAWQNLRVVEGVERHECVRHVGVLPRGAAGPVADAAVERLVGHPFRLLAHGEIARGADRRVVSFVPRGEQRHEGDRGVVVREAFLLRINAAVRLRVGQQPVVSFLDKRRALVPISAVGSLHERPQRQRGDGWMIRRGPPALGILLFLQPSHSLVDCEADFVADGKVCLLARDQLLRALSQAAGRKQRGGEEECVDSGPGHGECDSEGSSDAGPTLSVMVTGVPSAGR